VFVVTRPSGVAVPPASPTEPLTTAGLTHLYPAWLEFIWYLNGAGYHLGNACLLAARAREAHNARRLPPRADGEPGSFVTVMGPGGECAFYSVEACLTALRSAVDKLLPLVKPWLPRRLRQTGRMRRYVSQTDRMPENAEPAALSGMLRRAWEEWVEKLVTYRDLFTHYHPLPREGQQLVTYLRHADEVGYEVLMPLLWEPTSTGKEAGMPDDPWAAPDALVYCRDVVLQLHDLSGHLLDWCSENPV
jgi:hypothetical protein